MKPKPRILIVDDEKNTREGLSRALRPSYEIMLADSAEQALSLLSQESVDIILTDLRMPGLDGLELLERVTRRTPHPLVIMLTAYGSVESAVEAMKKGAYDFLMKPVNLDQLDILLRRAIRSREMETENVDLKKQLDSKYGLESIISLSPQMQEMFEVIRQAAPTQATVLIQGESGTGKELVAQAIHRLSPRAAGPFIAVHCAALSTTLLESELFGHEKGAFTGAVERRRGRFELADGGTLFLDEVSEIDPSVQVKLLRVLEERKFERVGGHEPIEVDIRLISATNRDLKALVDAAKFRSDLFFRLDVVGITLPPLRDRVGDVPLLCNHFLKQFSEQNSKPIEELTADALNILSAYSWPGNVRELKNTMEKMVVLTRGSKLTARDIPAGIRSAVEELQAKQRPAIGTFVPSGSIEDAEKAMILDALRQRDENRTKAAKQLGISRRTLHRKLRKYAGEEAGRPPPGV